MSLPTFEPLPDENESMPPAHRRRQRRMIIPPSTDERASFLRELSLRTVPSFDFYLFSLLAGLALGAAVLVDSPALFVLAALLAPFMAPAVGISLGTVTGTPRFVLQSLGSLGIGSLIVFLCGMLAGWSTTLIPARDYQQALYHSSFTWPDFFLLALGTGLAAYLIARLPNQRPLVASAAIAYELYLPAGVAGFGLSSGLESLWPDGLLLFFIHLVWAALIGTLVLGVLGLRPLKATGYVLSALYAVIGIVTVMFSLNAAQGLQGPTLPEVQVGAIQAQTITPSPTASSRPSQTPSRTPETPTPTITRTRTLVPTGTPTLTITPVPTPVWAQINASEGGGALIRAEPSYNAAVIQSLLNGTLVEVLPEVVTDGGVAWVHVRLVNEKEGWIVRTLLRTATPAPDW
jgi:uncharacterized membrane protein